MNTELMMSLSGSASQGPVSTALRIGAPGPTTTAGAGASPSPSTPSAQSTSSTLLILAIVVPTTLVVVMALVGLALYKRASNRNTHAKHVNPFMDPGHQMQQMAMRPLGQSRAPGPGEPRRDGADDGQAARVRRVPTVVGPGCAVGRVWYFATSRGAVA